MSAGQWRSLDATPEGWQPGEIIRVAGQAAPASGPPGDADLPGAWPTSGAVRGRLAQIRSIHGREAAVVAVAQIGADLFWITEFGAVTTSQNEALRQWRAENARLDPHRNKERPARRRWRRWLWMIRKALTW